MIACQSKLTSHRLNRTHGWKLVSSNIRGFINDMPTEEKSIKIDFNKKSEDLANSTYSSRAFRLISLHSQSKKIG